MIMCLLFICLKQQHDGIIMLVTLIYINLTITNKTKNYIYYIINIK